MGGKSVGRGRIIFRKREESSSEESGKYLGRGRKVFWKRYGSS